MSQRRKQPEAEEVPIAPVNGNETAFPDEAQTRRFFVVALFFIVFGMWMLRSDTTLTESDATPSPAPPSGILLASSASAGRQSTHVWGHELLPKDWPMSPVNIAHRGGADIGPENTLVGFREGLVAGAGVLELDVHLTEDGHLVVIHNKSVDDTTNGTGRVSKMTLQEVKRLDAGYDFTEDHGKTHPYRGEGVVVPTLEEVYQAFPGVPLNIEIKEAQEGIEKELWWTIEEAEAADRTLVVSGKMSVIRKFREVSGEQVTTGASIREMVAFILWSHFYPGWSLQPSSYQALQIRRGLGISRLVQTAHRSDIRVDVWTVDEEEDMRRLLGYGVDGIMTDRPDRLNRVLEGEGKG